MSTSEAAAAVASSSDSIEFVDQRNQALGSPRLQLALARWARERNWTDREQLFLQRVVSLGEPRLAASAASRLGLVREGNQFSPADDELAMAVVRMLVHIPDRAATLSLARHAIGLPWDGPVDRIIAAARAPLPQSP